jgi:hypothetical protein
VAGHTAAHLDTDRGDFACPIHPDAWKIK